MRRRHLIGAIAALAAALFFATTALANGQPKHQPQFTAADAQSTSAPDWFERYAAAHPYGRNLNRPAVPDVFERYAAAHPHGANLAAATSTVAPSRGFRWRHALIGAAAAAGLALLCAAGLGAGRARRRNQLAQAIRA